MNKTTPQKDGNRLWGIYHTDREYACVLGDPLRTVVEAPARLAAEEAAAHLGFGEPWAHPVTHEQAKGAQWKASANPISRQTHARKSTLGVRI